MRERPVPLHPVEADLGEDGADVLELGLDRAGVSGRHQRLKSAHKVDLCKVLAGELHGEHLEVRRNGCLDLGLGPRVPGYADGIRRLHNASWSLATATVADSLR